MGGRYRPYDAGFRLVHRIFEDEPEGAVFAPPEGALHSECISALFAAGVVDFGVVRPALDIREVLVLESCLDVRFLYFWDLRDVHIQS